MIAPLTSLLIVEDDPEISRLLADFMRREGFEVECADSGKAMDAVLQRMRPDLLVLDLMLPGEDGLSICRRLRADDNIPILSWLLLGGKCRNCKEPISFRYPAVELLTALSFVLVFWRIGFDPLLPVGLIFVAVTIALMFIDAEHMILPNVITYPFFVFALLVRIIFPIAFGTIFSDMLAAPMSSMSGYPTWIVSLVGAVLGALAGGGSLWLVGEAWKRFRGVEAMGLGDVKMMLGFGALLGWRLALFSIFIAAFAGAIIGIGVIIKQKDRNFQAQIPFGIFLGIGSVAALLFGEQMIAWYIRTFVP